MTAADRLKGAMPLAPACRLSVEVALNTEPTVVCTIVETLGAELGDERLSARFNPNGPVTDAEALAGGAPVMVR